MAVTASAGISLTAGPRDGARPMVRVGQLIEEADEALRKAKRSGRDRSQLFDDVMRSQRAEQTAMGRLLRDRLDESRIEVAVQPIVDPRTGFVSGGEVLARVRDDEGQLVPASRWIESAVRNGLVGAVDEAVILQAAELVARFSGMQPLPVVGVNLSDAMLARPDLEEWLLGVLDRAGADPAGFLIEVPETVFPVIRDRAAEALRSFSARGIWIAVDDFGTGYASL
ncbi:MAG: EAL domain-containing protein, partial [Actinomycetes bacterium]